MAEEYLHKVVRKLSTCKTTDQMTDYLYHHAKCQYLPPTSYAIRVHILRAFYANNLMTSVLSETSKSLDPTLYEFEVVNDLLIQRFGNHHILKEFTITCNCSKCATQCCPCQKKHLPCCSFCKCCSNMDSSCSKCRNPLG